MKTRLDSKAFALSAALLTISSQVYANPEVAIAYDPKTFDPKTESVRVGANTVLNMVQVKCPTAGYLIARATAYFTDLFSANQGDGKLTYYLKKNKAFAGDHLYAFEGERVAAPIQRVDTCKQNEKVTYRFQANDADEEFEAIQPRLVVLFYKDRI